MYSLRKATLNRLTHKPFFITILFVIFSFISTLFGKEAFTIVSDTYPPYEYKKDGKIIGMDVEILNEVAKEADIVLNIKFYPWKRALTMAKNGNADGIFSILYSKERAKYIKYPSIPLSTGKQRIFVNSTFKGDITKVSDLKGKTIGVVRGNTYGEEFNNYTNFYKIEVNGPDMLFRMLNIGRYSFVIENENVGIYTIKKFNFKGIRPLTYIPNDSKYYIGISKKSKRAKELFNKISEALAILKDSGKLEAIQNKYNR